MITETCESCGREFGCGAGAGACWCAEHTLSKERLAVLREHFERCLCPDCLVVAAAAYDDDGVPAHRDPASSQHWRSSR